jgi:VCBS repeat-containing protein
MAVITGTNGNNILRGTPGNDQIDGLAGNDLLLAGAGRDTTRGGPGFDGHDGGAGIDTALFSGLRADYEITAMSLVELRARFGALAALPLPDQITFVRDLKPLVDGNDGADATGTVERLQFADQTVFLVPNGTPVAGAATATTDEDVALNGTVAAADPDGDNIAFALAEGATHGSVLVNPDGTFTYTPDADYSGPDSFAFTASDGFAGGTSAPATVAITVNPVNDPPSAQGDTASASEDAAININVLANDSDPDAGDTISIASVPGTSAFGAQLSVVGGQIAYDPTGAAQLQALNEGQSVTDSFSYTIQDAQGEAALATVNVTVTGVNDVTTPTQRVMTFDAGSGTPASYTENGLTVTNLRPGGVQLGDASGDGSGDITLSGLYEFTFAGGQPFSLVRADVVDVIPLGFGHGTNTWSVPAQPGAGFSHSAFPQMSFPQPINFAAVPLPDFSDVTSVRVDTAPNSGFLVIDNLVFVA